MSYDKYIKIKGDGTGKGVKRGITYIKDDKKTCYTLDKALNYVENEAKTISPDSYRRLVSGWNCDPDTAAEEFQIVERRYHSVKQEKLREGQKANEAFHFISSYQGTDLDPELIHQLGIEFCKRFLGEDFQAVVCTHLNTNNYHNHILVNAYSLTKIAKFKDEYHLYKKMREITNELSLEHGLSIIMDNDNDNNKHYKSWAEVLGKGKFGVDKELFKSDMKEVSARTKDYSSFLKEMEVLGYIPTENKQSVSFTKGEITFRDTTLGVAFTRPALEEMWGENERKEEQELLQKEIAEQRKKNMKKYKKYDPIFVSEWDELGRHRGLLKRLLLLICNFIERVGDDYYSPELDNTFPKTPSVWTSIKRLERVEKAIALLDSYKIDSRSTLINTLKEAGQKLSLTKMEVNSLTTLVGNLEPVVTKYERMKEIEDMLISNDFDLTSIPIPTPSKEEIRQNLATLSPITPKMKSRLYSKMHHVPYRLAVTFNDLSNQEAREIIDFLSDTSTPRPALLLTREEYNARLARKDITIPYDFPLTSIPPSPLPIKPCYYQNKKASPEQFKILCQLKKAFPEEFEKLNPVYVSMVDASRIITYGYTLKLYKDTPPQTDLPKLNLSTLSPEIRELVKEYRMLKIASDSHGGQNLVELYEDSLLSLSQKKLDFEQFTSTYKELKFMERVLDESSKIPYVYGAAYPGQGAEFNQSKANLNSDTDPKKQR